MKRSLSFFVLLGALVGGPGAWTQEGPPADEPVAEAVSAWFVELHGRPQAQGGSAPELVLEQQLFRAAARAAGIELRERYRFDRLWNGLSVEVSATGLSRLTTLPEVKNVFPVADVGLPEPDPAPTPALETALVMTQADIARNELGLTGQGIRVAIIDTGVDYDHPDLGGCFGPGCRVEGGWDFVGDAYDATTNPVPVPDPLPDDCNGHGTHVAGILGADGGIEGVAPGVTFRVYKVFGCVGATSTDILLAAMERVLEDGADVLNLSVGVGFQWPQFPTAVAADALVDAGIVVAAAAGNNGLNGLYGASAPGVGEKVMAVANFVNSHANLPVFTVSPDGLPIGYAQALPSPPAPLAGTLPLARTGTAGSTNDACNSAPPLPPGSLAGKAALVRRGTCSFHEKARNARNAGAAAVVIYNDTPPLQTITVPGVRRSTCRSCRSPGWTAWRSTAAWPPVRWTSPGPPT
jgi:minor extracellular serine protease Vpr